ncbi:hypothetical protein FRB94_011781 [Tulasnella sp. JGI-2019a]|nr:hypothetical protein FRB93_002228 [Tulasnella sp. JGI-2019a]KAG9014603.1 hypothetical protein FRB94_011781 [Tulasnella sp. JGI-2019a]KAG9038939.1 hypothetical protein FRB95_013617 [Tulasnella sp. JGI-2019a]
MYTPGLRLGHRSPFRTEHWLCLVLFFVSGFVTCRTVEERSLSTLGTDDLHALVALGDPEKSLKTSDLSSHLSKILIPRPVGSENNTIVRQYIISTLKKAKWHVEEDTFKDNTPYGEKSFTNIIATWDPTASRKVIMAAHHDSKYFSTYPANQFVGATDSAAPCAMLLDLAEMLSPLLEQRKKRIDDGIEDEDDHPAGGTTLQLVFFDGEEAFKDWTATDSIYGARHLAEKWASTYPDPNHQKRRLRAPQTIIQTIDHFILLDLLGAVEPLVRSWYPPTAWLFDGLVSAETRLGEGGFFDEPDKEKWVSWSSFFEPRTAFHQQYAYGSIEDDHLPFLRRGVSVLHVISNPFPKVWHTLKDDASALDLSTMKRWNLIFRVFMVEYLGLKVEKASGQQAPRSTGHDGSDLPS